MGERGHTKGPPRVLLSAEDMFEALAKIASFKTWNECALSTPQERPTKADIANQRDDCIAIAREALSKATPTGEASDV